MGYKRPLHPASSPSAKNILMTALRIAVQSIKRIYTEGGNGISMLSNCLKEKDWGKHKKKTIVPVIVGKTGIKILWM